MFMSARRLVMTMIGVALLSALFATVLVPALADVLAPPAPDPFPRVAFVARNDVAADALAVGPVAGALGGITVTTPSTTLSDPARQALEDFAPEVVYVAGGTAAIDATTYEQVDSAGPWEVRRLPGVDRDDTARLVAAVLSDLGVGRPLLTGDGQVVGDAYLGGTLTADELVGDLPGATTWADKDDVGGDPATMSGGLETLHELSVEVPVDGVLSVDGTAQVSNPSTTTSYEITLVTTLDYAREPGTLFQNLVGYASTLLYPDDGAGHHRTALVATGAVAVTAGTHDITLEIQGAPPATYDLSQLVVTFTPDGSAPAKGVTLAP